ncbi:MAG TPA: protein kinase [Urbifossiella sp.]|nr:protein kinase [Urbifossiella sp.]
MIPSDSLHLDEHLARLLAAYDQGLGNGDGRATIDVPAHAAELPPGERRLEPLSHSKVNVGSVSELMPDSARIDPFAAYSNGPIPEIHRIGRFELRKQLGKGGCGIVFLAYDPKLKREVALKVPRPELFANSDARRRLLREAMAAASFDHPNLVPVYETGEIGPICFIATVFCQGVTLSDWLERQSFPVPIRQAARLVAQLAEAVQHAHDRGVLHRDLKPNNVILQEVKTDSDAQDPPPGACPLRTDHFIPRVVDFGLAKLTDREPSETATRQILGTPKYMAPEQAQARHEDVGPEADVYALGVILYEMLAGRTPYDGATDIEVLRLSVEGNLKPPRSIRKEIPRDLEAICLKAMDRIPSRRYRSALDLADDLRRFLDGLPTLARPLNMLGRTGRWLRRNDQVFALAVLTTICCFLLAFGIWNVLQARKYRDEQDETQVRDAERARIDARRRYSQHVRDAFLAWRAGDSQQHRDSLREARVAGGMYPEFTSGYVAGLGTWLRTTTACPAGPATALALPSDDSWIATGHANGTVMLWDRGATVPRTSVKAFDAAVSQVAFLDGGRMLVAASLGLPPRCWSIDLHGQLSDAAVAGLPPEVASLAASADGQWLGIGTPRGEFILWNAVENRLMPGSAAGINEPISVLAVSPDGKSRAWAGRNGPVRVATAGSEPLELPIMGRTSALAFIPKANSWLLAVGGDDGVVRLFNPERRLVRTLSGHTGPIATLTASVDGSALASGGMDGSALVWNVNAGTNRATLRGHDRAVPGVGFAAGGRLLVTAASDGTLKTWDLAIDPEGATLRDLPAAVVAVAMRPNHTDYAAAFADGSIELASARGAASTRFPPAGRTPLTQLKLAERGPPLGVELAKGTINVWEFSEPPRLLFSKEMGATAADLHLSTKTLAVGDAQGRISIWPLGSSHASLSFDSGAAPVKHLAFSDNGQSLAAGAPERSINVWKLSGPIIANHLPGRTEPWLVKFLGDDRLAVAARGGSIRVWVLATGKEEFALHGHLGRITSLAGSTEQFTLASGTATGEVKLWDLRTGVELLSLTRHRGPVLGMDFASDNRLLITGGAAPAGRGELAFWNAPPE